MLPYCQAGCLMIGCLFIHNCCHSEQRQQTALQRMLRKRCWFRIRALLGFLASEHLWVPQARVCLQSPEPWPSSVLRGLTPRGWGGVPNLKLTQELPQTMPSKSSTVGMKVLPFLSSGVEGESRDGCPQSSG